VIELNRPLYQFEKRIEEEPTNANAGLWYDKFFDLWKKDFKGIMEIEQKSGKHIWINRFVENQNSSIGEPYLLSELHRRQRTLIEKKEGLVVTLTNTSPFVTGLGLNHPVENGFKWHHTLGVPYLPGSSIKGLIREWAENWEGCSDIERIFGESKEGVGSVIILDALPVKPTKIKCDIMTPHYSPYYSGDEPPADWHPPTPIPFLVTDKDQIFQMGIIPRKHNPACKKDCELVFQWLKNVIIKLGAGAKTAVGYGRFEVEKAKSPEEEWIIKHVSDLIEEHGLELDSRIEKLANKYGVRTEFLAVLNGAPTVLAELWGEMEEGELKNKVKDVIVKTLKQVNLWNSSRKAIKSAQEIYEKDNS